MASLVFVSVFTASFVVCNSATDVPLVVNTTYGPIRGVAITLKTNKSLVQFLGVPFAQAERFDAPKPPDPWTTIRNATSFGKACPQVPNLMINSSKDTSEDCLTVNVFVPNTGTADQKPFAVMVWIYGGEFAIGESSIYSGVVLATEGEVVVVTFNYRVGILGFLSTGTKDIPGNFGLLDQVQALHWVQKNIARFGGDPNNVTLFGQSAGGASVGLHMLSPLSHNLFHKAILQSGTATSVFAFIDNSSAVESAKFFAASLGCEMSTLRKCLENKNISELLQAQKLAPPMSFLPVVDHNFLKDSPLTLFHKGSLDQTVPVMIGVTKNEGGFFVLPRKGLHPGVPDIQNGLNKTLFDKLIKSGKWVFNENNYVAPAVIFEYTDWSDQGNHLVIRQKYMDVITDAQFKAPAINSAKVFVEHNMTTYFYQFDHSVSHTFPPWAGVVHTAELKYVFGKPFLYFNTSEARQNNTEIIFSQNIMLMWSNFAKTGNPTPKENPFTWSKFTLENQEFASLNLSFLVQNKMLPEKMAFWNSYIPRLTEVNTTQVPIISTAISNRPTISPTGHTEASANKGTENVLIGVVVVLGILLLILLIVLWRLRRKLVDSMSEPGPTTRLI